MTNSFIVAVWLTWLTNVVDTPLNPRGDEIIRTTVISQTHTYTIPGFTPVTNTVAVATNVDQFHLLWIKLPPVPSSGDSVVVLSITNHSKTLITNSPLPYSYYK